MNLFPETRSKAPIGVADISPSPLKVAAHCFVRIVAFSLPATKGESEKSPTPGRESYPSSVPAGAARTNRVDGASRRDAPLERKRRLYVVPSS